MKLNTLFTRTLNTSKISSVVAKSTTGLGNSETYKRTGASTQRLFLRPRLAARKSSLFMGLCGADFGQAGILYASSFQPCTVPTTSDWKPEQWVARLKYKAMVMANKPSFPVDAVAHPVDTALDLIDMLLVASDSADKYAINPHSQNVLYTIQATLQRAADAIDAWSTSSQRVGGAA